MMFWPRLLIGGLVALLMATGALAERRVALVIGNAAYTQASRLANPANDARLMAETLERVGFEVTRITDVDQLAMKRAMLDFGRKLRDGVDASLFYYAGHGVQADGRNYLIPVDAAINDESELDFQAIDVNAFLRVMETSSSRVNIVVLDACRNNPFESSFRSASRGLAMVDAPRGTYIAYSTAPGEVAEDGNTGNSPYTSALVSAIATPGIKIEETFKRARATVLDVTGERQVPWETSSITGDFYFTPAAAAPVATAPETQDAPTFRTDASAAMAWSAIQNSANVGDYEAFIAAFGHASPFLRGLAEQRIAALRQQQTASLPSAAVDPPPAASAPRASARIVPQIGHSDWIRALDYGPDGRLIVSASDDLSLRIWDIQSGGILRILKGHTDWVRDADWSPDGERIVSVDRDGRLIIWDAETGDKIAEQSGRQSGYLSVAWSPDGRQIAVGGYGHAAELRDGARGELIRELDGHSDWIRAVAWSPDGALLATASDDGSVIVWRPSSASVVHTLQGHTEYVKAVAWSADGRLLASGSDDKSVRIWDARTGTLNHALSDFEDAVETVAWAPDRNILAAGDNRYAARIYDGDSGRLLRSMEENYQSVQHLVWSPDGRTLAAGGSDRDIELWDPTTGSLRAQFASVALSNKFMAAHPGGDLLAIVVDSSNIDLWDLSTGWFVRRMSVPSGSIQAIEWSPDGQAIATGGSSNKVRIFDAGSGALRLDIDAHTDWVRALAWSPDSGRIVSAGDDNLAVVWDATNGARQFILEGHTDWVFAAAWSPDGSTIATGANDGEIRVWRANSGAVIRTIAAESNARKLLFSGDSRQVFSADGSSTVTVWNVEEGTQTSSFTVQEDGVSTMAWSPDRRRLVAAGTVADDNGRAVGTLRLALPRVRSNAWIAGGRYVATLDASGTVDIWDARSFDLQMSIMFGGDGEMGILYPDGTVFASPGSQSLFAVVDGDTILGSVADHDRFVRTDPVMPR